MSIINDALKKAEEEKTAGAAPKAEQKISEADASVGKTKNFNMLIISIIALSAFFCASAILVISAKKKSKTTASAAPKKEQPPIIYTQPPTSVQALAPAQPAAPQDAAQKVINITAPATETAAAEKAPEAPQVSDDELPRPRLNGTIIGGGEPLAMIENIIVKKGEYINGALVVDILSDSVELEYKGRRYKVRPR